jgi:hypothetical protein
MNPTVTKRSSIEQRLLVRSLQVAVAGLDSRSLEGHRVVVDFFALTQDQAFAKALVMARLKVRGLDIVDNAASADRHLEIFATGLGVDQGETLISTPATFVPFVLVPIPELALFKWTRHRGISELQSYTYDWDGHLLARSAAPGFGRTRYDQYTVLILVPFLSGRTREAGVTHCRRRRSQITDTGRASGSPIARPAPDRQWRGV